jgi:hypothetical protein
LKLPGPPGKKPTVSVGVIAGPLKASVTAAVHVEGCPTATCVGKQLTFVEVKRLVTVNIVLLPLTPWVESRRSWRGSHTPRRDGPGACSSQNSGQTLGAQPASAAAAAGRAAAGAARSTAVAGDHAAAATTTTASRDDLRAVR